MWHKIFYSWVTSGFYPVLVAILFFVSTETRSFDLKAINQIKATKNCPYSDLSWADFSGMDLSGSNLTGANLFLATLAGSDLTNARLVGAILNSTDLTDADLSKANLSGAIVIQFNILDANLCVTILPSSRVYSVCWQEFSSMKRANLTGTARRL